MRRWKLPVVVAVLTLVAPLLPAIPAHAVPLRDDHPSPEWVVQNFIASLGASDQELNQTEEIHCIEAGTADCGMTAAEVQRFQSDLQGTERELHDLAETIPEAQTLRTDRSVRNIANVLSKITRASKNPAVQKLGDKTGQFADLEGRLETGGGALSENTALDYAKGVVSLAASFVPPVGDILSLADSIANGDIESGIVAVVSLTATAVALAFPPAGGIIAAGLAIYSLGKLIWDFFRGRPRDWIQQPPANPQELFESGADIKWDQRKIGDQTADLVFSVEGEHVVGRQTLLLDSTWTPENHDRQPVTYLVTEYRNSFPPVYIFGGSNELPDPPTVTTTVYQKGLFPEPEQCVTTMEKFGNAEWPKVKCSPTPFTIESGSPAVLELTYTYPRSKDIVEVCGDPPCVFPRDTFDSVLQVYSENQVPVPILLPFVFGAQAPANNPPRGLNQASNP
ncbi:hypothetical protein [Actinocrispum wychmicini]|nr:hypothetical protein [Actinocrispum wychmicini]